MHYVGLDVHAHRSTYCVLDANARRVATRTVHGPPSKVIAEIAKVNKPFEVCFEASTGYGFIYEALRRSARRVLVAHPGQLRLIFRSKRKCDRLDAERLARLLHFGQVPSVHVPNQRMRDWRKTIRMRGSLVVQRTGLRCRVRALLRSYGVEPPRSLWNRAGMKWLRDLAWSSEFATLNCQLLLSQLEHVGRQLRSIEKALDAEAARWPGIALLRTIPGVGPRTAEAVFAYIDNPDRFSRNETVGSYFGLVPCVDASGGKERLGHITRQGPGQVRGLLTEAAWQSIRRSRRVRTFYETVTHGDPARKKIAIVACAHMLLRCMHAMLRDNSPWSEQLVSAAPGQWIVLGERRTA